MPGRGAVSKGTSPQGRPAPIPQSASGLPAPRPPLPPCPRRFFCTLQPLLAAVHGSQHPAVFFSRRPGVPAGGSGTAPPSALQVRYWLCHCGPGCAGVRLGACTRSRACFLVDLALRVRNLVPKGHARYTSHPSHPSHPSQTPVAAATLIRDASGNSNAAAAANGTSGAAVGGGPGSPFAKSSNNNSLFTALNSAAGLPAADSRAGSRKPSARDLNAPGHPQSLHQHTQLPQLGSLAVSPAGGAAGPSLAAPVGGGGSGHMNLHHHLAQLAGIQTTSTANSNQQAMHSTMDSNISALLMMSLPGMAAQGGGGECAARAFAVVGKNVCGAGERYWGELPWTQCRSGMPQIAWTPDPGSSSRSSCVLAKPGASRSPSLLRLPPLQAAWAPVVSRRCAPPWHTRCCNAPWHSSGTAPPPEPQPMTPRCPARRRRQLPPSLARAGHLPNSSNSSSNSRGSR